LTTPTVRLRLSVSVGTLFKTGSAACGIPFGKWVVLHIEILIVHFNLVSLHMAEPHAEQLPHNAEDMS
jgi:hypothetical protein